VKGPPIALQHFTVSIENRVYGALGESEKACHIRNDAKEEEPSGQ
jgi:hypothetical protein